MNDQQEYQSPEQMNGASSETSQSSVGQMERMPGNVDKIRDILFGANMRDYDARFQRLEAAVLKETGDLRESTRQRFETLESFMKKELESLRTRLKSEREERADALGQSARKLQETADALDRKLRDLEDHTDTADSEIRQEILNHTHALTENIRALQVESSGLLDRRFQELNRNKTDRATLGNLLSEIALRLTDEFQMPTAEK